jgi:hypothetical protein
MNASILTARTLGSWGRIQFCVDVYPHVAVLRSAGSRWIQQTVQHPRILPTSHSSPSKPQASHFVKRLFVQKSNFTLERTPCMSGLVLSSVFMSPKLKMCLKGSILNSFHNIQRNVTTVMTELTENHHYLALSTSWSSTTLAPDGIMSTYLKQKLSYHAKSTTLNKMHYKIMP